MENKKSGLKDFMLAGKLAVVGVLSVAAIGLLARGSLEFLGYYTKRFQETYSAEDFNRDGREDLIVYDKGGYPRVAFMQTPEGNYERGRYELYDGVPFVRTGNRIYKAGEREPMDLSDLTKH